MTQTRPTHRTIGTSVLAAVLLGSVTLTGCSLKEPVGQAAAAPTASASAAGAAGTDPGAGPSLEGKTVGIAAKDILHDYSRVVYERLQEEIESRGGTVIATQAEAQDSKHVTDVENLLAQRPDAIVVVLGDAQTLTPALKKVDEAGIPLFTVDFQTEYSVNNVTSDNWHVGTTLARTLAEDIGGSGKVLAFNGFPGVAPCRIRYNSLKLVLEDYPGIEIIEPELQDKYEGTIEDARRQIDDQLRRLPEGEVDAIWSCWDMPLIGAAQAVDGAGREDIGLYAVDAEPGALDLVADPESSYEFTVAQPTHEIAAASVDNVALFLDGRQDEVATTSYADPIFITKENVGQVRGDLGI
jgi:ribose transport system substrate-binding protein